jgi:hypothetical protein
MVRQVELSTETDKHKTMVEQDGMGKLKVG